MKFVIAKVISGHWHHYVRRCEWSDNPEVAQLFDEPKDAHAHITLMPDGDEEGAVVLPAEIIVHYTVDPEYQP